MAAEVLDAVEAAVDERRRARDMVKAARITLQAQEAQTEKARETLAACEKRLEGAEKALKRAIGEAR